MCSDPSFWQQLALNAASKLNTSYHHALGANVLQLL
jgi:hypothetical protein